MSDCLPPCLVTEASVVEGIKTSFNGFSGVALTFNQDVRVKKTAVDQFSFMGSLNFFGSNLGLWPGLGLYQILEWMMGILITRQLLNRVFF